MEKKKTLSNKHKMAAIFASFAILLVGTLSLMESMSLDYYSVLGTLEKIAPAALALGAIGWCMGLILDQPRKRPNIAQSSFFINDLMKKELSSVDVAEEEENSEEPI